MKRSNQLSSVPALVAATLLAGAWVISPRASHAAEPERTGLKPAVVAQRLFASPDEAIKALQAATETKDRTALRALFGPQLDEFLTGDEVLDGNNAKRFAAAMALGCQPVKVGENTVILEIGTNNWPLAVPLVKVDGQWHFDSAAGKEEVISRHIGKDELNAIGVCRAYVTAQRQYASMKAGGGAEYARKFKSTPGTRDGLYWASAANEPASPFGPLVAEAHAEGYVARKGAGPHPFHGYIFRILTQQGKAAPGGKMNYLTHGNLTAGFALVAYPEYWDRSGIMTFIVNQDGRVFQQNLGERTARIAAAMKEYNPDTGWTLVQDAGRVDQMADDQSMRKE